MYSISEPWDKKESNSFGFNYEGTAGPTDINLNPGSSYIEFFEKSFTGDVWQFIVTEINQYAGKIKFLLQLVHGLLLL